METRSRIGIYRVRLHVGNFGWRKKNVLIYEQWASGDDYYTHCFNRQYIFLFVLKEIGNIITDTFFSYVVSFIFLTNLSDMLDLVRKKWYDGPIFPRVGDYIILVKCVYHDLLATSWASSVGAYFGHNCVEYSLLLVITYYCRLVSSIHTQYALLLNTTIINIVIT